MDPQLLELLRCPQTGQKLRLAAAQELEGLLARQKSGELLQTNGEKVAEPFEEALITEDGVLAYVIRGAISVLLIPESIPLR